jgi:hypothetical protein
MLKQTKYKVQIAIGTRLPVVIPGALATEAFFDQRNFSEVGDEGGQRGISHVILYFDLMNIHSKKNPKIRDE